MENYHLPVLPEETVALLDIKPNGTYVDGTAGGGGHSSLIAGRLETGRLICIDRDPDAIALLREKFSNNANVTVMHSRYSLMCEVLDGLGIGRVDGVLLDIGVSSHQLDTAERGFSFHSDAPLDMRMSQSGMTAAELVAGSSWQRLAEIFSRYGEEKYSVRIAKAICAEREKAPIATTTQLAEVIRSAVPAAARRESHPARKVFQALRIAVNDELGELERGLEGAFSRLSPGGRLAVITFHSLEDRMVKRTMNDWTVGCTCPPDFPVCVCGGRPKARLITKKPVEPGEEELERNPRCRSSKLRVCERLPE